MARKKDDDNLLIEDELTNAFLGDDDLTQMISDGQQDQPSEDTQVVEEPEEEEVAGQLAVDMFETSDELVIKARIAGVSQNEKDDLVEVSISEGILTISGELSSGEGSEVKQWHIQECYWGYFNRTVALPVAVKEDEAKAGLKDGILTITFPKVQQEQAKKIQIM